MSDPESMHQAETTEGLIRTTQTPEPLTPSVSTQRGLTLSNTVPVVGCIHVGSCGDTSLRQLIDALNPDDYPNWIHLAVNTDAKSLRYNFLPQGKEETKKSDGAIEKWQKADALEILQAGGDEVTQGFGTGGDPIIGKRAALSKKTLKQLTAFIKRVHFLLIEGAVGGGTGTGVIPVIVRLAKGLGIPAWAIVVVPDPREGRDDVALPAIEKIRKYVLTTTIENADIEEYLDELEQANPGSSEDQTYQDVFKLVNEESIVKIMQIVRQIVQGIGRGIHKDLNDLVAQLNKGKRGLFGIVKVPKADAKAKTPTELKTAILKARFQDQLVISEGVSLGFWAIGPWGFRKANQTRDLIMGEMIKDRPNLKGKIKVFQSINFEDVEEMWMAALIVAPENPEDSKILPHSNRGTSTEEESLAMTLADEDDELAIDEPAPADPLPVAARTAEADPASMISPAKTSEASSESEIEIFTPEAVVTNSASTPKISFRVDGTVVNPEVTAEFARKFNRIFPHTKDRNEMERLQDEVVSLTGQRPDLPPRFAVTKEVKNGSGRFGFLGSIFALGNSEGGD